MEPDVFSSPNLEPPPLPPAKRRILLRVFPLLGPLLAAMALGLYLDGEFGHFLLESWNVALLAVLCVLGYAGLERRVARVCSWLLLLILLAGGVFLNIVFTLGALHDFGGTDGLPDPWPPETVRGVACSPDRRPRRG